MQKSEKQPAEKTSLEAKSTKALISFVRFYLRLRIKVKRKNIKSEKHFPRSCGENLITNQLNLHKKGEKKKIKFAFTTEQRSIKHHLRKLILCETREGKIGKIEKKSSPILLTRRRKLLLHLPVWPRRDLNFLRAIFLDFIGTRITCTVFTRHTLCDGHFTVAQKDYRTVVGLVNTLQ